MLGNRGSRSIVSLLVATFACFGGAMSVACGQDADDAAAPKSTFGKKDGAAPKGEAATAKGKAKGDPVKSAFSLPSNVVLNARQQRAFDQFKSENEAPLRDAADRLQDATSPHEEAAALNDLKKIRSKIRSGIQAILSSPNPRAPTGDSNDSGSSSQSESSGSPGYGYPSYPANWPSNYPAYYPGYYPGYYPHPYYGNRPPYSGYGNGYRGYGHGQSSRSSSSSSKSSTK